MPTDDEMRAHLAEVAKTCPHDQPWFVGVGNDWKAWCKLCASEITNLRDFVEPAELDMVCPHCGETIEPRLSWSGPHIKAECPTCERYVKFVRQIRRAGQ